MSAILGVLGTASEALVRAMGERLAHRGASFDLENPATDVHLGGRSGARGSGLHRGVDGCIVADAALYNREDLLRDLEGVGAPPEGASDAEILFALYRRFGAAGLAHVNGEFAFAIWDDGRRTLVLGRDPIGAQPLYFAAGAGGLFLFGSEYKAFFAADRFRPDVDRDMLQFLQHHKQLPTDRTLLREIRPVPPGTVIRVSADDGIPREERIPLEPVPVNDLPEHVLHSRVAGSFLNAMRRRIDTGETIGVSLSGGIDSIGVLCALRKLVPNEPIHTFTCGYGPEDPEVVTARIVAEGVGSVHHEIFVTPDRMAARLPELVWHLEDPIGRSETLALYEIGQLARNHVDALLSGLGADGLYAGMPKHKILWMIRSAPFLKRALTEFFDLTQTGRKPDSLLGRLADALYFRNSVPPVPHVEGSSWQPDPLTFPPVDPEFINQVLTSDFEGGMARRIPKMERPFAAAGLRYTSPFFDRDLVRTSFTIPSRFKIRFGQEKYILRQALKRFVPAEVLNVQKHPMKMKHDLAFSDALDAIADHVLSRERTEARGFFHPDAIRDLRRRTGRRPYSSEGAMRIWTALLTEVWAEVFLDRRGTPTGAAAPGDGELCYSASSSSRSEEKPWPSERSSSPPSRPPSSDSVPPPPPTRTS